MAKLSGMINVDNAVSVRVLAISNGRPRAVFVETRVGNDLPDRRWLRTGDAFAASFKIDVSGDLQALGAQQEDASIPSSKEEQ